MGIFLKLKSYRQQKNLKVTLTSTRQIIFAARELLLFILINYNIMNIKTILFDSKFN